MKKLYIGLWIILSFVNRSYGTEENFSYATAEKSVCFLWRFEERFALIGNDIKKVQTLMPLATGFFIREDSTKRENIILVTNKHVFEGQKELFCFYRDSTSDTANHFIVSLMNEKEEKLWRANQEFDIAAIRLNIPANLSALSFNRFEEDTLLKIFDEVIILGYPAGLFQKLTAKPVGIKGEVALKEIERGKKIIVNAFAYPGMSGSPVFLFQETLRRGKGFAISLPPAAEVKLIGIVDSSEVGLISIVPANRIRETIEALSR